MGTVIDLPPLNDHNRWADYLYYLIGVNVIPAHTQKKTVLVEWKKWQLKSIPEELHQRWKTDGKFADGLAIIVGKVHRGEHKGKNLVFVDLDNLRAIEEFCTRNGETVSLKQIGEKFIVEQHLDDTNKAHIYFYSEIPFVRKSSDGSTTNRQQQKRNVDLIPAFEVKGKGTHGIAFCSPSVHKNGERYQIIGTATPVTLSEDQAHEMMDHLDAICRKHGIVYLENEGGGGGNGNSQTPIRDLFKDDFVVYKDHNRHLQLLRAMESLIKRKAGIFSLDELKDLARKWNEKHCSPPLDITEFEKQWRDATKFISRMNTAEEKQQQVQVQQLQQQQREEEVKEKQLEKIREKYRHDTVMKYSGLLQTSAKPVLYESVKIAGMPCFVSFEDGHLGKPKSEIIDDTNGLMLEPYKGVAHDPYAFVSKEELEAIINDAQKETLDSLWDKVHAWVVDTVDTDDPSVHDIITTIIIFSHFQDRLGMTPYLFIHGPIGTGKGAIIEIIRQLGYRVVIMTVANAANVYRLLESVEKGQVTIIIDEANHIEDDITLLEVCKTGYKGSARVPRILDATSTATSQQIFFFTFGLKILVAEHEPKDWKAAGFKSRCIPIKSVPGVPKILINEVVENAGDPKNAELMRKIASLRKLLFAFRMIHFAEPIPNVEINITGRDRELCLPIIRLFKNAAVIDTIKKMLFSFVSERKDNRADSFDAFMCSAVDNMLGIMTDDNSTLEFSNIWKYVEEELEGKPIEDKPRSVDTALFGEVSVMRLTGALKNLGGKKLKDSSGKKRIWVFNLKNLARFKRMFGEPITSIEVISSPPSSTSLDVGRER